MGFELVWWLAELAHDQKVSDSVPATSSIFSSEAAILNLFMSAHSVKECMIKITLPLFLEQASIAGKRRIRISHQSSPTFESQ